METMTRDPREAEYRLHDLDVQAQALRSVFAAVADNLPSARVRTQFKRLWPRRLGPPSEDDAPNVTALVLETLAFARDPKGRTAFDRAARNPPFGDGTREAAALALTCRAVLLSRWLTASTGRGWRSVTWSPARGPRWSPVPSCAVSGSPAISLASRTERG